MVTIYEKTNYEGKARTFYTDVYSFPKDFYGGSIKIRKLSSLEVEDKKNGKFEDIISPENIDEILNEHNKYRQDVGVSNLAWDEQLAASSKLWANTLTATNPPNTIPKAPHDPHTIYGENIHYASGKWTGKISTETYAWGKEKQCFKNGLYPDIYQGPCAYMTYCTAKDGNCVSHYSQMIWRNTQKVGCAKFGYYWVCRYDPAGNIPGKTVY